MPDPLDAAGRRGIRSHAEGWAKGGTRGTGYLGMAGQWLLLLLERVEELEGKRSGRTPLQEAGDRRDWGECDRLEGVSDGDA